MQINFQTLNILYKAQQKKLERKQQNAVKSNQSTSSNPFSQLNKDTLQISFGSDHCTVQNFKVKDIENLHCPACGLVMLTERQIATFINEVSQQKGEGLVRVLEKYENESTITKKESRDKNQMGIFRPIKKQVVDVIKKLAKENPNLYLDQLVALYAQDCIDKLIDKQLVVCDELFTYINQNIQEPEKEKLLEKLEEYIRQIKGISYETFSRKRFIYGMKQGVTSFKEKNEIEAIASKLPTSENDVNSFFVKYSKNEKRNSKLIAEKLVNTAIPTAEHLQPKSKGGKDRISNYICDCAECNSARGNTDFYDWIQTLPEFEEKLQDYIYDIQDAIDDEKLSARYDTYIEQVIDTIATLSEGEIILEIPDSKNPKKIAATMQKRQKDLSKIKSGQTKLEAKKAALEKEIATLEKFQYFEEADEYREIQEQLDDINQKSTVIYDSMQKIKKPLDELKAKLYEIEIRLNNSKNNKELQKEYKAAQAQYEAKQDEYDSLDNKLGKLKKRKIRLKKQKRNYVLKENEKNKRINELTTLVTKITQAKAELEELGNVNQKMQDLTSSISAIQETIEQLEAQNTIIEEKENFNANDKTKYSEYAKKCDLLTTANKIITGKEYKKFSANAGYARELIEYSKNSLQREINELSQNDEVIYFINQAKIRSEEEKKSNAEAKLIQVQTQKKQSETLSARIEQISQGKTLDSVQKELSELRQDKQIRQEIYGITRKRTLLEHLTKTIEKNASCIQKMENHQNYTSSQWSELLNSVDLDDVI